MTTDTQQFLQGFTISAIVTLGIGILILKISRLYKRKIDAKCPNCNHVQTKGKLLPGKYYLYQVVCDNCGMNYTFYNDPEIQKQKKIQKIVDNDPILKKLQKDYKKIGLEATEALKKTKINNPDIYANLVRMGVAPKDLDEEPNKEDNNK